MTLPLLRTKRLQTALISLVILTVAIGIIITPLEKKFGRLTTFQTTGDGMWWAVTTVTSVGYGDYYPVTVPGRILGSILSVLGVTMFGIVIALVTVERFDRIEELLKKMEKKQGYDLETQLKATKEH